MPFEYLDHTADIGIRGIGKTVEEAFCEAARAIFNLMVDLEEIVPEKAIHVTVEARQLDLLLVDGYQPSWRRRTSKAFSYRAFTWNFERWRMASPSVGWGGANHWI